MLFTITLLSFFAFSSENNIIQPSFWNGITSDISSNYHTDHNICEGLSNCVCSRDGNYVNINCKGLKNIAKLLHFLKLKHAYTNINHVYISRSFIDHLPPKAFINLLIQKIFIRRSIVGNISEDAFQGIIGLIELHLDDFNLSMIPSSVGKLNNTMRAMWMEHGDLETIEQTLQNCSQMQLLSLRANRITRIHHLAFLNMTHLNKLDLSDNSIEWLDRRTFSSLSNLNYLTLFGNRLQNTIGLFDNLQYSLKLNIIVHLSMVPTILWNLHLMMIPEYIQICYAISQPINAQIFVRDINLEKLILSNNTISEIGTLTRRPLYSLNYFYLLYNPLKIIKNDSFKNYPDLVTLNLAGGQLTLLEPGAFKSMIRLSSISIERNNISYIDNNIFSNLNTLQKVSIAHNHIKTIDELFQNTPQIRSIYAAYNEINAIGQHCFQNTKLLKSLFLTRNFLRRIEKDTFINNEQLQRLQLINNEIEYLEPNSFRGLYSLQQLVLTQNLLTTLNGSIKNLPSLKFIDLDENFLMVLDSNVFRNMPNLQTIYASSNLLKSVEGAFVHLTSLQKLRLESNQLMTVTQSSFFFPERLKYMELFGNALTCNCLLKWIVESITEKSTIVDNVICRKPEWLNGKRLKELSLDDVTQWPRDCPHGCICTCFPNSTDYYIAVYCAGLNLTTVPSVLPSKTGYLDLSRNEIDSIPQLIVDNLTQLQYIFLDENNLTSIPDFSALKLHTLTLAKNHLTRFPVSRVDSSFLQHVTLSNNPWMCDCQTLAFSKWLIIKESVILDINSTRCDNIEVNGNLRNQLIVSLTKELLCPSFLVVYISIAVVVLGFFLFVTGGKIVYIRYRMNIKIWMYSKGICSSLSCIKEEDLNEDKRFDAFVSYSGADETFVVQKLVPMLESGDKPYHLCLHYRHFAPGSYVQDSIIQAVQLSKRIILVLSQNFLQSEWCRLEFKSAHHLVLEERLNRLIVIILGELPPKDEIDPEIKLYLETTTYLQWGDNNFWNKLKYVMPRTPCVVTEEDRMRLLD